MNNHIKLRFKVGDRVLIADDCKIYEHQNKDKFGNVYGGVIREIQSSYRDSFNYTVMWDKGARSTSALYHDRDLVFEGYDTNKEAAKLLSKEW